MIRGGLEDILTTRRINGKICRRRTREEKNHGQSNTIAEQTKKITKPIENIMEQDLWKKATHDDELIR